MSDIYSLNPGDPITIARRSAQVHAMQGLEANPDEAARAYDIGHAAGIPPGLAYDNREQIEEQYRQRLSSELIAKNSHLQAWINENPIGAKVANDDYHNLDEVTEKLKPWMLPMQPWLSVASNVYHSRHDIVDAFKEGLAGIEHTL